MKMPKGMVDIVPTYPTIVFDLDTDPLQTISTFPEWIQKRIMDSETYKERIAGSGHDDGHYSESSTEFKDLSDDDGELPF